MGKLTIQEIARLANVSVGTVDRALRSRKGISPNTRERVLEVARRLNYQPNPVARALSLGRAHFRIGVCLPRIPEFFDHLHEGVLDEVHRHEHLGLQVVYHPYRQLGVDEVEGVRAILSQDIQALVVCPTDPRVNALIDEAEVSNIRVLCMFSEARGSSRSTVVWVDPGLTGRLAAELMGKFVSPGSEVAVITGLLDMDVHRRRTQSFLDTFPTFCAGGRVVEVIVGHKDQDQGFQKCVNLLERTKTLAGIWVGHGYATPICWALRARGLAGNVTLVATHLHRDMIPYIENGSIHASIYQDLYAH